MQSTSGGASVKSTQTHLFTRSGMLTAAGLDISSCGRLQVQSALAVSQQVAPPTDRSFCLLTLLTGDGPTLPTTLTML